MTLSQEMHCSRKIKALLNGPVIRKYLTTSSSPDEVIEQFSLIFDEKDKELLRKAEKIRPIIDAVGNKTFNIDF